MVFTCLLSIILVVLFPEQAIHQASDANQSQHAGLWRGVFSHKQALGVISGLTTGLLLFYGSLAFSSPIFRFGALGVTIACLGGTQSATGLLTAAVLTISLYTTFAISRLPLQTRKVAMNGVLGLIGLFYVCFHFGLFDLAIPLLGKSTDLTGRTDVWPWIISNIRNSGSALLGGGYGSGWEEIVAPSLSIDNGYIELLVSFGYLGTIVVLAIYARVLWGGRRLILSAGPDDAAIHVLPFNIMLIELFINITEANFMTKSINTVFVVVAMYQITRYEGIARRRSVRMRRPAVGDRRPTLLPEAENAGSGFTRVAPHPLRF
jgi:exopolysaccharide production protein ExoQ